MFVRKQEEHDNGGNKEAAGFKRIVPRYLKIQAEEAYRNKCYSDRAFKAIQFLQENAKCFRKYISEYLHTLESSCSNKHTMFNINRETQGYCVHTYRVTVFLVHCIMLFTMLVISFLRVTSLLYLLSFVVIVQIHGESRIYTTICYCHQIQVNFSIMELCDRHNTLLPRSGKLV